MKTYPVKINVKANNEAELFERLQAFQDLQDHLSHQDFVQATEVIVQNPALVDFIKQVLPEDGRELTLMDYLQIARKAYSRFG